MVRGARQFRTQGWDDLYLPDQHTASGGPAPGDAGPRGSEPSQEQPRQVHGHPDRARKGPVLESIPDRADDRVDELDCVVPQRRDHQSVCGSALRSVTF
jgi:hypothetical protein